MKIALLLWHIKNSLFRLTMWISHSFGTTYTLKDHQRYLSSYISVLPPCWLTMPVEEYFGLMKREFKVALPATHEKILMESLEEAIAKYRYGFWVSHLLLAGVPLAVMENMVDRIMEAYTWTVDYPTNIHFINHLIQNCGDIPTDRKRFITESVGKSLSY